MKTTILLKRSSLTKKNSNFNDSFINFLKDMNMKNTGTLQWKKKKLILIKIKGKIHLKTVIK